jgi:competence ComEA-like helix-hairpin-helix protein
MNRRLLAVLFVAAFALQADDLPPGKGKDIIEGTCGECHGLENVTSLHQTKDVWQGLVEDMVGKGADLKPAEVDIVVEYLATNFGPLVNVNRAIAKDLAEKLGLTAAEADLIVKYRTDHGSFKTIDDLYKAGVDRAKLDRKKDQITF